MSKNQPYFTLLPVNNNRTGWRPISMPVVLTVPRKRNPLEEPIANSGIFNVRVAIENVPQEALVAGHDHVGMRHPDKELYAINFNSFDYRERIVDISQYTYRRGTTTITYSDLQDGDIIEYISRSGRKGDLVYYQGADYYDLSDIAIETETLPSGNYILSYVAEYYNRITSEDDEDQFLCVDDQHVGLATTRIVINHPGEVLEEFYRHTPPPYLTNASKSQDTTVALYRPFTDMMQDISDEQGLLERLNWVYDVKPEIIPYLSSLLGWDLPYFPKSLDQLRRAVLRRTVDLQNLKGSKKAIIELFRLFGFEILISNLYWSTDGKRLIRPGDKQPDAYVQEQIDIVKLPQVDLLLDAVLAGTDIQYKVPLLFRPQVLRGLDNYKARLDGGSITIDAFIVENGSDAYTQLQNISNSIKVNPDGYGDTVDVIQDNAGFLDVSSFQITGSQGLLGHNQILVSGKLGLEKQQIFVGQINPLTTTGVRLDRDDNFLNLTLNGYHEESDDYRIFIFATYYKQELIVPESLTNNQSNKFDIQILIKDGEDFADPTSLEFSLEFLRRIRALHSLLNLVKTSVEQNETYEVTDLSVGGTYSQAWYTDIGKLQVPPAILPNTPNEQECSKLDPVSLGYKPEDIILRQRKLKNLIEEYLAYKMLDDRPSDSSPLCVIEPNVPQGTHCAYTEYGQDRVTDNYLDKTVYENLPKNGDNSQSSRSVANDGVYKSNGPAARESYCDTTGAIDFKYKGRVGDTISYKSTLSFNETYTNKICGLGMGSGVYWSYPSLTTMALKGTANRSLQSKSDNPTFSGGSSSASQKYYASGPQGVQLNLSYDDPRPLSQLSKLYRAYDNPNETIHFSNRIGSVEWDQKQNLALQRPEINIEKATLHLPGCRFINMYALMYDYTAEFNARPWDDAYSQVCGNACGNKPTFLHFYMQNDTYGDESLVYDQVQYSIIGNGIPPDIVNLGDHSLGTDMEFVDTDVIHSVYLEMQGGNPAITLDQACDISESSEVSDGYIVTNKPLFNSYSQCGTDSYHDFADGYPCIFGYQSYTSQDLGRSGLYDDVLEGLGLNLSNDFGTNANYLFALGSGILNSSIASYRLDCGCLIASCDNTTQLSQLPCPTTKYVNELGRPDFNNDQVRINRFLSATEVIGVETYLCNGAIPTLLELV